MNRVSLLKTDIVLSIIKITIIDFAMEHMTAFVRIELE